MSQYPEHDKLSAIKDFSQKIGEFLEWLKYEKRLTLCRVHEEHDSSCYNEEDDLDCGLREGDYFPVYVRDTDLLAEFFDIDQNRLENEKRAMLEECRKHQESSK